MKKTLLLAGVATVLFTMNANAVDLNPYIGAKLRYIEMSSDVKLGDTFAVDDNIMGGSLAIGTSFKVNKGTVRTELEYNKNQSNEKTYAMRIAGVSNYFNGKFEIETQSVMLNAYYDFETESKLRPYIGAGLGFAKNKGSLTAAFMTGSIDNSAFAWQVGAGTGYKLTDNITVDAGYRYVDYGDISGYGVDVETSAHELYIGARYAF